MFDGLEWGLNTDVEAYDCSDKRFDLGNGVMLPTSWRARVLGEQGLPVVFAALEREVEGVYVTAQVLREL